MMMMKENENEVEVVCNDIYESFVDGSLPHYRYYILYGGRGSGKTEATAMRLVRKCVEQSYFKCLLIREYFTNVKDSNFAKIVKVIEDMKLEKIFKITTSPLEITCTLNGNKFLARGLDNPSKIKSTENPTDLWIEEADAAKEKDFRDLDFTLRSDKDVDIQVILSFNPYDENHWIIKRFFPLKQTFEKEDGNFHEVQSTKEDCYIIHTTYKDNDFADKQYLKLMETTAKDDPDNYKVDGLGLFGKASKGVIYPVWKAVEEMKYGETIYGVDYGYTNPSTIIEVSMYNGELYLNERFYESGYTQHQLAEATKKLGIPNNAEIYYDAAESSLGAEYDSLGMLSYPADKGAGSVEQGIKFVKRFKINVTKSSTNLIKEFRNYKWQATRHGEIIEDKPIKMFDHGMDAFRYAVYTHGRKYNRWIDGVEPAILNIEKNARKQASNTPDFNFRAISKLGSNRQSDNL